MFNFFVYVLTFIKEILEGMFLSINIQEILIKCDHPKKGVLAGKFPLPKRGTPKKGVLAGKFPLPKKGNSPKRGCWRGKFPLRGKSPSLNIHLQIGMV
jgi:hypothetical protein